MQLIYKGVDITQQVKIHSAVAVDNAGGEADSLRVAFADPDLVWSRWAPRQGDAIALKAEGYTTGTLFVDGMSSAGEVFSLSALSLPQRARACASRVWEDIRLLAIAADIAGRYGLELKVYDVPNPSYKRVEQLNQPDMAWLNGLCLREGCMLKLAGNRLIIYGERAFEQKAPAVTADRSRFMEVYQFRSVGAGLMAECRVIWNDGQGGVITGRASAPVEGGTFIVHQRVASQGEADRFAAGLLRQANKKDSGMVSLPLNTGLTGGNTIAITGAGLGNGTHFITRAEHDFIGNRTVLSLRRPLEGGI